MKKPSGRNGNGTGDSPGKKPDGSEGADRTAPEDAGKKCAAKKVKTIRAAVAGGNYRVEAKEVAGKIVDDAVREIRRRLP